MTRTGTAPAAPKVRRPARRTVPSRRLENELLAGLPDGGLVAGMDEVGRGALAGPVSVGVAVVGAATSRRMPKGLADSKLLSAQAREDLVAPVRRWCAGWAVAHASPAEIDEIGIIAALRLAGRRALAELAGAGLVPGIVILDGVHDWLSEPAQTELFAPQLPDVLVPGTGEAVATPPVRTQVKADASCAVVAAASVLAKVTRDSMMVGLDPEHPQFGWAGNKGYSSAEHVAALAEHGACELHRRSWRLPGLGGAAGFDGAGGLEVSGLDDAGYDAEYDDDGSGDDAGSEGVGYGVAGSEGAGYDDAGLDGAEYDDAEYDGSGYDGGDGHAPERAAAVGAGATVAAGRA